MFGLSPPEILAVAVIAILLFGSKLPDVARSLGGSYREFRRGLNDMQQQFRDVEREITRTIDVPVSKKAIGVVEDDTIEREPSAPRFVPPPVTESQVSS